MDRERIKAQILQNRERRVRAKQREAVRVKQQRALDLEDLRKRNLEEAERVKIQSLLAREERDERRQKLQQLKVAQEERSREIYSAKVGGWLRAPETGVMLAWRSLLMWWRAREERPWLAAFNC